MIPKVNKKRKNVHYEVLGLIGRKWSIVQIVDTEDEAKEIAETRWKTGSYKAIRVVRERYERDSGNFNSLELLYKGRKRTASKYDDEDVHIRPCVKEDDLYCADARRSMNRFFKTTFEPSGKCATELLHDFAFYQHLDSTGMAIQSAVQKASIILVRDTGENIQVRMKKLFDLIGRAATLLKNAEEKGRIPSLEAEGFPALVDRLEDTLGRCFPLTGALVHFLRDEKCPLAKVETLLSFMDPVPRPWVCEIIDQYVSELICHKGVLTELIGSPEGNEAKWVAFIQVARGCFKAADAPAAGLTISRLIGMNKLPSCKQVFLRRIGAELRGTNRLTASGEGIRSEFSALHRIADSFEEDSNLMLGEDTLEELLEERISRQLNSQTVGAYIEDAKTPVESAEKLLDLGQYVVGIKNTRSLANYILPIITSPENESYFRAMDGKAMERLRQVVRLQKLAMKSEFQEIHKRKIMDTLDGFAVTILERTQMFRKLVEANIPANEKGRRLLSMIVDGYFTEGRAIEQARDHARVYLKTPGFMEEFMNSVAPSDQARELLKFRNMLMEAKLGPQETPKVAPTQETGIDEEEEMAVDEEPDIT